MDNPSDIFSLCRLCLVKDQVNISIFDEQGDIRQIFLKISSCLPIKVSRDDKLPKKICDDCSNKLDLLYEFWNSSANAEKTLLSWLGQAGVKDAGGTINAVAQQIAKPTETLVKLESGVVEGNSVLISPCVNNVDNESFNELPKEESEAAPPPPKRTRRSAAVKAQINIIPESEDDDDIDTTDLPTKLEDGPEDSDAEDKDPSYTEVPGTSANDQPGPSGVGKAGGVEAPCDYFVDFKVDVKEEKIVPNLKEISARLNKKKKGTERKKNKNKEIDRNKKNKKEIVSKKKTKKTRQTNTTKSKIIKKVVHKVDCSSTPENNTQNNESIECEICNTTYSNNVAFALHSTEHSIDKKYSCHLCSYKNQSKYHIELHIRAHEGTTKYKCEICQKAFTVSTHATEHKFFHTGEKPFQCEICGKHFMFSRFLAAHRRAQHYEILTGSPLVKFDCKICNKHYSSASGLRRHKLSKHNENGINLSVLCDICGKTLSSKEKLKFHRRIHTGYKPFACQVCSKAFTKKDQLIEHVRVHTGEKPHICKYCGRGFTQRTPLKIHERTHNGEKPYNCVCCGKGFVTKTSIDSHMKNCGGNNDVVSAFASTWMGHPVPSQLAQFSQTPKYF